MNEDLVRVAEPVDVARTGPAQRVELVLPQLIVDAGPVAVARFLEFFAARIANRRTRAAYGRAVGQFLAWCEVRGLALEAVSPLHVAAYIRTHPGSAPTVKQHLAAIRMLGDWLVVSQVLPVNPAAAVRGPKHVVTKGATPVLSPAEARRLLEAIDTAALAGRRDRALVSVMLYSFARVSAVIGMRRQDYFRQESRGWLRLHEKGGKRHDVPAHHRAAEALDDYLELAGLDEAKAALFQSVDPAGRRLTGRALSRRLVLAMIKRRAAAAGLPPSTCCHTFRATGITAYLSNGGTLEHAQQIAGHASPKTTKLYDRTADTITVARRPRCRPDRPARIVRSTARARAFFRSGCSVSVSWSSRRVDKGKYAPSNDRQYGGRRLEAGEVARRCAADVRPDHVGVGCAGSRPGGTGGGQQLVRLKAIHDGLEPGVFGVVTTGVVVLVQPAFGAALGLDRPRGG